MIALEDGTCLSILRITRYIPCNFGFSLFKSNIVISTHGDPHFFSTISM